jgi:hypothetical protein
MNKGLIAITLSAHFAQAASAQIYSPIPLECKEYAIRANNSRHELDSFDLLVLAPKQKAIIQAQAELKEKS